jgi:hypothetical protein
MTEVPPKPEGAAMLNNPSVFACLAITAVGIFETAVVFVHLAPGMAFSLLF